MKRYIFSILSCFVALNLFGQVSNLSIDDDYEVYRDSLKRTPYPWNLPIMGAKVRELGFDIPYPNGVSLTYGKSVQSITIDNLEVGFDPNNLVDVSRLARFQSIKANVNAVIARYDFWLFPFLNFFGMAGRIDSKTDVHLALPIDIKFQTQNSGTTLGWGTVMAAGVGPFVMAGNLVQGWTFVPNLDKPSRSLIVDGRAGYMFRFKHKPEMNLVFLVGAQYLGLNPNSKGKADLEKLVGITPEKKAEASEQLDAWYGDLNEAEKELFGGIYEGLSGWLNADEPVSINYVFNKRLYYPMSMTLGVNYQLNHRFQFNSVYTFLGSREQLVFGVGYRFGIKGKNLLRGVSF